VDAAKAAEQSGTAEAVDIADKPGKDATSHSDPTAPDPCCVKTSDRPSHCNCKNSNCLKLYCVCFKEGTFRSLCETVCMSAAHVGYGLQHLRATLLIDRP
jgi:Tesmin/TSO1-like CXC domain, cysteine-rich domain